MSRYNTLNPLDSNNAKDLDDNAKNLDQYANSEAETFRNRFGVEKKTLAGLERSLAGVLSQVSPEVTLAAGQLDVVVAGFNASLSVYYIDGARLSYPTDYTYADTTTEQITLTKTRPAGSIIIATAIDPSGSGLIAASNQLASLAAAAGSTGLAEGDVYWITDVDARVKVLPNSSPTQVGDITNASGQVLQLMPAQDGQWNVLWFGADPTQNNQYLTFDLAAQRALQAMSVSAGGTNTRGPVRVPAQNWTLGQQVPTEAIWFVDAGAEFTEPTNYLPSNTDNLEYLKGEVFKIGARGFNVLQLGSPDLDWVANNWRASSQGTAVLSAASSNGAVGISVFTRSSDNPSGGEGTIGVQSYVANDNETNLGNTYNYFGATYKSPGAGTTFNTETNVTTIGTTVPVFPYGDYGGTAGITVNHWVGGPEGGTVGGFEDVDKRATSAGMVFSPGLAINPDNGNKWGFDAGIVFLKVAFENGSQDVIRSFTGSRFQYWRDGGGDSVVRLIGNEDEASAGSGKYEVQIRDVSDGSLINYRFYRDKLITTDNKANLGQPSNRWITGYFYNSPDVVSDRTEKDEETELTENEINCFIEVGKLTKKWKWKKEIEKAEVGETIYWHVGPIAQDLWDKMEEYGLDPSEWGLVKYHAGTGKYSIIRDEVNCLVNAAIIAKVGL